MSLGNFKTIVETADKMLTATRAREFTESVRARGSFELAPQPGIELVLPPLLPDHGCVAGASASLVNGTSRVDGTCRVISLKY